MTEPRKLQMEHKVGIPTLQEWGAYKRQAKLYTEGLPTQSVEDWYRQPIAEETLASYAKSDAGFTMEWWRQYGRPILVNKLRGRAQAPIFSLNDLIHPETLERMSPETPGCGCVR